MLKRIGLAAMALMVLAAAVPAHAQHNRGQREPREGWFMYQLNSVRDIPFDIIESGRRAQADIERQYPRSSDSRNYRRERYDHDVIRRGESLGPYVWGRRYPWNSCSYSWNARRTCEKTEIASAVIGAGATVWNAIEARKLRREMSRANNQHDEQADLNTIDERPDTVVAQPPVRRHEPTSTTLVNLTGCRAIVGEQRRPLKANGDMVVDPTRRIYVEVDSDTCDKYLDPIGKDVLALKCR